MYNYDLKRVPFQLVINQIGYSSSCIRAPACFSVVVVYDDDVMAWQEWSRGEADGTPDPAQRQLPRQRREEGEEPGFYDYLATIFTLSPDKLTSK